MAGDRPLAVGQVDGVERCAGLSTRCHFATALPHVAGMGATTSPGRRRTRVPGGRQVRVVVRLTGEEYVSVSARAAEIGHTVPSYLALTGLRPEGVASADIKAALTSLHALRRVHSGIANNLNQLTAKLHATGEVDRSLPAVMDAVAGLTDRINQAVERVGQLAGGRPKR